LNVKNINLIYGKEVNVALDTKISPELEEEGYVREICRKIQALRKNSRLVKTEKIKLSLFSKELNQTFEKWKDFIKNRVGAKKIILEEEKYKYSSEEEIKNKKIKISLEKYE
jgi:isoleucyl-tRNA synthetase